MVAGLFPEKGLKVRRTFPRRAEPTCPVHSTALFLTRVGLRALAGSRSSRQRTVSAEWLSVIMTLSDLKTKFAKGEIEKAEFIRACYEVHDQLFAYGDMLCETDVEEISIRDDGVRFLIRDQGFSMLAPRNEAR